MFLPVVIRILLNIMLGEDVVIFEELQVTQVVVLFFGEGTAVCDYNFDDIFGL